MSGVFVKCPFEGCPYHEKPEYTELARFRRHLAQDHDRYALFQFAFDNGIIEDPIRYQNANYVIQQVAEFSRVEKK